MHREKNFNCFSLFTVCSISISLLLFILSFTHIFPKSQVTSKMHNFRNHFWAQFFMLFHLVWFILFGVLGRETTFSLVEILQQPIRNFHFKVFRANTRNKMDHIMWKSMKNCAQKWCRSLCAFLFEATCAFGKMWAVPSKYQKRRKILFLSKIA